MDERKYITEVANEPVPNHGETGQEMHASVSQTSKYLENIESKVNALLLINGIDPASLEEEQDVQ